MPLERIPVQTSVEPRATGSPRADAGVDSREPSGSRRERFSHGKPTEGEALINDHAWKVAVSVSASRFFVRALLRKTSSSTR
jgi:hypothetical protein